MVSTAIKAGVVYVTKFVQASQDTKNIFGEYISYMGRDEAIRNGNFQKFSLYPTYMGNPEKTTALFSETTDQLGKEDIKRLQDAFNLSQKNSGVLWQDVISFDNRWLEKQGLFDSTTGYVNEEKLKAVTRSTMNLILEKMNGQESVVWTAAIHYNTDNIHIHLAYCEPHPTRTRGLKSAKVKDAARSKIVNEILKKNEHFNQMDRLVRDQIIGGKKELRFSSDRQFKKLFFQVYSQLPDDRRQWNYKQNSIHTLRPLINEMSRRYINKYHAKEYANVVEQWDKEALLRREAYGDGEKEKNRYEQYKENKINDLYTRLGNAILKEMREYSKEQAQLNRSIKLQKIRANLMGRNSRDHTFKRLRYYMDKQYDSWKNQRYYDRLENELERE